MKECCPLKKKSLIDVSVGVDDYNCLPRCIALGMRYARGTTKTRRTLLKWTRDLKKKNQLRKTTKQLIEQAGIDPAANKGCSYIDLVKLVECRLLKNVYNIVVYNDKLNPRNRLVPRTRNPDTAKTINLFLMDQHYVLLLDVKNFFGMRHMCNSCDTPYNNIKHRCENDCPSCRSPVTCVVVPGERIKCGACNRRFKSFTCYGNHTTNIMLPENKKSKRKTVCDFLQVCGECCTFIDYRGRSSESHTCTEFVCSICSKLVPNRDEHECFIQKYEKNAPEVYIIDIYRNHA